VPFSEHYDTTPTQSLSATMHSVTDRQTDMPIADRNYILRAAVRSAKMLKIVNAM